MIIATPTNYEEASNSFATSSVESVVDDVLPQDTQASIIIKSIIPVGYTVGLCEAKGTDRIIF